MKRYIIVFLLFSLFALSGCKSAKDTEELEVHFINVGQADASLIISGDNAVLVDGGNTSDSDLIYSYLTKHNIKKLDLVIVTHAHDDHIGGIPSVFECASVKRIIFPDAEVDNSSYRNFKKALLKHNLECDMPKAGEVIKAGDITVEVLYPLNLREAKELNNTSVVCRVKYKDVSFMFTGDIQGEDEMLLVKSGFDLSADVLKVAHHGSDTSSCYDFVKAVKPSYAVISSGMNNPHGHPAASTVTRLVASGCDVLRTDTHGTIIFKSDGNSLSAETQRDKAILTGYKGECDYVGNVNSRLYHTLYCPLIPPVEISNFFSNSIDAKREKFQPCPLCLE